jgi:hypothetical protein
MNCATLAADATQVPLWAALLIGLGGGVVGTLLTLSHERGAEMRTRMLTAADDFILTATQASHFARDLMHALQDEAPLADTEERLTQLHASGDRFDELLVRVTLLYGQSSATMSRGETFQDAFLAVTEGLAHWREHGASEEYKLSTAKLMVLADIAIAHFGRAARSDVRFGIGARLFEYVRSRVARGWDSITGWTPESED